LNSNNGTAKTDRPKFTVQKQIHTMWTAKDHALVADFDAREPTIAIDPPPARVTDRRGVVKSGWAELSFARHAQKLKHCDRNLCACFVKSFPVIDEVPSESPNDALGDAKNTQSFPKLV